MKKGYSYMTSWENEIPSLIRFGPLQDMEASIYDYPGVWKDMPSLNDIRFGKNNSMGYDDIPDEMAEEIRHQIQVIYDRKMLSDEKIEKITIKSSSGYGPADEAYEDKLTIADTGIQYEYKPIYSTEKHQPHKWSYRTDGSEFRKLWQELCEMMPDIIECPEEMCLDAGEVRFVIAFASKNKIVRNFWGAYGEPFWSCFRLIKKMVPGCEEEPTVLWTDEKNND